jgi:hypothetical protein
MKRIFYIYTEATVACLMLTASLIEFICGFFIPDGLSTLAFIASGFFLIVAFQQVLIIVDSENKG